MSRVHDALRRAERAGTFQPVGGSPPPSSMVPAYAQQAMQSAAAMVNDPVNLQGLLEKIEEIPFRPLADAHLIDPTRPSEAPSEEFRTLRTRLNHMQSLSPIHSIVVTSPSPAEGKSFTAVNLALAQSHLAGNLTLLGDFDFRRPIVHTLFQVDRAPA